MWVVQSPKEKLTHIIPIKKIRLMSHAIVKIAEGFSAHKLIHYHRHIPQTQCTRTHLGHLERW